MKISLILVAVFCLINTGCFAKTEFKKVIGPAGPIGERSRACRLARLA